MISNKEERQEAKIRASITTKRAPKRSWQPLTNHLSRLQGPWGGIGRGQNDKRKLLNIQHVVGRGPSETSIRFNSDMFFWIISKLLLFESVIIAKLEGLVLRASTNLVESLP